MEHSDHQEQFLMEKLRESKAFIPELSLVAKKTSNFGISFPFNIPEENGMAVELAKDRLKNKKGVVKYPHKFGID